ncbi:DUF1127 domain-containing protein [Sulfitobacter sabulilitoris]|uniref:DUF1127 domain-containing protein n=1 Tax=Sulfitobacter sabulilitoris TaxID=2562655 RepID=A0A5S3PJB8_9RHOB|nr:DUF1127 domain-containing protein [Sulfitobacter sabulilitoris]TMM54494.1 DUF1127 domain-containing protein [Sulfitobacter sabulilitoris]
MTHAVPPASAALATLGRARSLPVLAVIAVSFAACVTKWATRRRTRMALRQLDASRLDDVGLTPAQAHREAGLVFWRT